MSVDPAVDGNPSRAVITLAMGRAYYFNLACNLARSFLLWNKDSGISFHLFTDLQADLPPDLMEVKLHRLSHNSLGTGFSSKLKLDLLLPADLVLFVDSDCLCFGSLKPVFDAFRGHAVGVVGERKTSGEFFGDISSLRQQLDLPWVPTFVGAVYYMEKGSVSTSVFQHARSLEPRYDSLGLVRLRGVPNEEPLLGLSLAHHHIAPLPDDGKIKADAMHYQTFDRVDVLRGEAILRAPVPGQTIPEVASPVLVHFNCHHATGRHYLRESCRLEDISARRRPRWFSTVHAFLKHDAPMLLVEQGKHLLRPLFRALFGTRAVKKQSRDN